MIDINNKKIAIIGGAGFIGHNLALALKKEGAEIYIIDSLQVNNFLAFSSSDNHITNREFYLKMIDDRLRLLRINQINLIIQDARDYGALTKILSDIKPQILIHLSAVSHASISNKDPYSTFDHSLRTLENALDCARGTTVEHFIYFSSSMIYGDFKEEIVTEETICDPIGIYGVLKFAGEKIVIAYNQVFNLPYTIIRPSALYGERCVSKRVGQIFIENALTNNEIEIHGDGNDRLDFTYIEDLVNGVLKVIENENAKNQIFNLTYGKSHSISDLMDILKEHFSDIDVTFRQKDEFTPHRGTLSIDKANKLIGYTPQYPLNKGFVKYIEWYKNFHRQFKEEQQIKSQVYG